MPFSTLKMVLFAPIPSANERTTTIRNPGLLRKPRIAYRKSCPIVSNRWLSDIRSPFQKKSIQIEAREDSRIIQDPGKGESEKVGAWGREGLQNLGCT
jgi:hypothetical protein